MNRASRLSVVAGEALSARTAIAVLPNLESQPFRSGELPQPVWVELTRSAAVRAAEESARAGIPTELWVRIAVEATRHIRFLAEATGSTRHALEEILEGQQEHGSTVTPIEARRQRAYAQYVRAASPHVSPQRTRSRLSLALPDVLGAAWAIDAAEGGVTVSIFVSGCVDEAPRDAVAWEAASAVKGQQLSEWIYREWLAAIRPQ